MNARQIVLLLAALVAIAAALWLGRTPGPTVTTNNEVLTGLKAALNDVNEVVIARGDGPKVTLMRSADAWIVVERGYTADVAKLRRLLLDLSALTVIEAKTSNPQHHARLGVEDMAAAGAIGTRVDVTAGEAKFSLIVGKNAAGSGVYVREAQGKQALLMKPDLTIDTDPKLWLDRRLLDIAPERLAELEVTPASGRRYSFKAEENSEWKSALKDLRFDDVAKTDTGAEPTSRQQASYRTTDGLAITISGREAGDDRWITLAAGASPNAAAIQAEAQKLAARLAGFEFQIEAYTYDRLFPERD
jgi:hypothetical protein